MEYFPSFSLETWILLITFVCLFVMYGQWTFGVFEKMGIPGPKPFLYWGTLARHDIVYYVDDTQCAQKYGRLWGMYEFRRPLLAVMDPDMLKTILVKECFTYFTNRRNLGLNGDLYDTVSIAEDDLWRRIRNILSPTFTSGRLKEMFTIMKHQSCKLKESLQAHSNEVISVRDFFGPYSLSVMVSCLFSVDMDLMNNPSSPFITHASKMFNFSTPLVMFQGFFPFSLPLLDLMGFSLFSKSSVAFFKTILDEIKAERKGSSSQKMGDVLQYMLDSQSTKDPKREKQGLTDHEIQSQASMFVFAGYETSALTLLFLAYNLARNPDVMERLQMEIDATFPDKAPVDYEALMQMEYLDCVVHESLRLYPPAARLERIAKETVKINGIQVPKGMTVMVPVYALHRDPELWPEPEEFRPERFSKENKPKINPYTYLPFGIGPRNCLGMRFALVMVKLAMVEVLQNYSFSVCEETEIPLQMNPKTFIAPLRPIKLKLVPRSDSPAN
ncbi:cytochrome P450 3A27-like [Mugil cephalus]|uniref:cytochrome P450 3A27-like n=1 Tax=Mugil cephalus TaxID=48193 RepID=UPI001FB578DD|nr:cytochrome P450 3A27-like [Mugil cephalus]